MYVFDACMNINARDISNLNRMKYKKGRERGGEKEREKDY